MKHLPLPKLLERPPEAFTPADVARLLQCRGADEAALFARADALRRAIFGDAVPVRAILEISNQCANQCLYCGIRASRPHLLRYRMSDEAILAGARAVVASGVAGTLVLQSGETPSADGDRGLARLFHRLKTDCPTLALTLSAGNRPIDVYRLWKDSGLDRYLLRFETSDSALFEHLHPNCTLADRLRCLRDLRTVGLQVGTGFMIGLPGATTDTLVRDLLFCRELDPDMIGIGPFLPSPGTPLADIPNFYANDPSMIFRAIAVLRLLLPRAHIPATTALDVWASGGRDLALQRGANVFMPNATPRAFRLAYQLYPGKPSVDEDTVESLTAVPARLRAIGRFPAPGPSHSLRTEPNARV